MSMIRITDKVSSVGVLNPSLRIFDIIMSAKYGTSYNSYVIDGGSEAALIETVHIDFFDEYIDNIKQIVPLEKIKYLIMNHNEPDHSGSVKRLLELIPNLKIVASKAGEIYLKSIINGDADIKAVKDNDELKVGEETLRFVSAPFLHWPDSMFTYFEAENLLFTCDFFGAHYCQDGMLDKAIQKRYISAYQGELENYYIGIFSPFNSYVRSGLEKLKGLNPNIVCTSHGPILTKGGMLEYVVEKYSEWSREVTNENPIIPIFYCSAYQNTEKLAFAVKEGIKREIPEAVSECYDLNFADAAEMSGLINRCDAFLLGSPTINRDAVAPIWNLISHIDAINSSKKSAALFGSYGWSGEALPNLRGRLEGLKIKLFEEDLKVVFVPSQTDLDKAVAFGERFAKWVGGK